MLYEILMPLMETDEAELGGGSGENNEELEQEGQPEDGSEEDQEQGDKIPKSVFLAQKRELKALKRQMREFSEKQQDTDAKRTMENAIAKMADKYDEDFVEVMREFGNSLLSSYPKVDKLTEEITEDIQDMGSPDAIKYKKEIIDKIKRFRKAGEELTVEEAYELVRIKRPHEDRLKEEQKELYSRRKHKEPTSGGGSSLSKDKYNFTEKDKSALTQLQRLNPDAGWTEKKYYEIMKRHADL
jgi:hypothetical protein